MSPYGSLARIDDFRGRPPAVADAERDAPASALLTEIARLRARLDELSAALPDAPVPISGRRTQGRSSAGMIKNVIDARSRRGAYLPPSLFADPAWDMLLDLFLAHHSQLRISVSSLCIASNVPTSTALRWLKTLEEQGLISRRVDPLDARRHFIDLTQSAVEALTRYFSSLQVQPPVL